VNDFEVHIDTDYIANWSVLELPISGPAGANTLVILTGSAFIGLDVDDQALSLDVRPPLALDLHAGDNAGDERPFFGQLLVRTGYLITAPTRYRDVGGDGGIQQTTYATLAHIEGDDTGQALVAIDAADAYVDEGYGQRNPGVIGEVVVRIQLAVRGDCTLDGVAYQVRLLLHKEHPELWGAHPVPTGVIQTGVE
jgi:hypothetical protein